MWEDVLEEVAAIGEGGVGEGSACGDNGWLEWEFVLKQDLKVELLHLLFHLLGYCLVCLVGHGRLVDLELSKVSEEG